VLGVALQPDIGTAAVLAVVAIGRVWAWRSVVGAALGAVGLLAGAFAVAMPHVRARLVGFVLAEDTPQAAGFQIHQAGRTLEHANWFGPSGFSGRIPSALGDFAFVSTIGQFGLVIGYGVLAILALAVTLEYRALQREPGDFAAKLVAQQFLYGQSLANLMSVTGLVPVIGIPLPMLSVGGSSAMATTLLAGICLRRLGNVR
jgi:cell division protein FtsW